MERVEHPKYKLLAPCFLEDDTYRDVGTIITYLGTPNGHMEPLNPMAEERMTSWLTVLDEQAAIKAALDGKAFVRRAGDMGDVVAEAIANRPQERRQVPRSNGPVPVRPDMVTPAERRRAQNAKAAPVLSVEAPPMPKRGEGVTAEPVPILGSIGMRESLAERR